MRRRKAAFAGVLGDDHRPGCGAGGARHGRPGSSWDWDDRGRELQDRRSHDRRHPGGDPASPDHHDRRGQALPRADQGLQRDLRERAAGHPRADHDDPARGQGQRAHDPQPAAEAPRRLGLRRAQGAQPDGRRRTPTRGCPTRSRPPRGWTSSSLAAAASPARCTARVFSIKDQYDTFDMRTTSRRGRVLGQRPAAGRRHGRGSPARGRSDHPRESQHGRVRAAATRAARGAARAATRTTPSATPADRAAAPRYRWPRTWSRARSPRRPAAR